MFFEDEKDTTNNPSDNSIEWEDVLSGNDDSIISDTSFDDDDVLSKISNSDDDDFVDSINLDADISADDDDAELEKILKDDTPPRQKAFDAFGAAEASKKEANTDDDINNAYDIDQQLAGVIDENDVVHKIDSEPGIIIRERKVHTLDDVKRQFTVSPKILVLLVVFILFSVYHFLTQYSNNNGILGNLTSKEEVEVPNINTQENKDDIPVLSEDDIETPDAKAMLGAEKKQTVEVQQAGRINPFLPDKKYQSTEISYASSGILNPPTAYGEADEATDKMLSIAVSGIMYDPQKPSAIILYDGNDYFVQKGDKLNDYKVIDISRDYVAIALGKNIYKARVGEEFKITSKFYGSAQYNNGGRQYYSVDMNKDSENGYVSDTDVEIRAK